MSSNIAPPIDTADVIQAECESFGKKIKREERNALEGTAQVSNLYTIQSALASKDNEEPLTALCISGGGIRSATFNLGVVQELARLELLSKFDYLSTVSGGGYLGSWLSAWIHRKGISEVQERLSAPNKENPAEAPQISHLRAYSNYLSPHMGLMSADTWTLIAIWLRNTLLNWLVLIPVLIAVLLLPRLHAWLIQLSYSAPWVASTTVSLFLIFIAAFYVFRNLPGFTEMKQSQGQKSFLWYCLLPVMLAGLVGTGTVFAKCYHREVGAIPYLVTFAPPAIWLMLFGLMAMVTALLSGLEEKCWIFSDPGDQNREWSARAAAWLLMISAGWLALCGVAIWVPYAMHQMGSWVNGLYATGGVAAVISALLGKSEATAATLQAAQKLQREGKSSGWASLTLPVAATIFIVIFLSGLSLLGAWMLNRLSDPCSDFLCAISSQNPFWLIVAIFVTTIPTGWFIHVNKFSIHSLYRNRLMRAYLGASREPCVQNEPKARFCPVDDDGKCAEDKRKPNRFTGFDKKDNLFMKDLAGQKPMLVVNTALNLVHGRQLAWQDRKAEPFTITPLHAGSAAMEQWRGAYRPVGEYTGNDGLTLATAMSVSGAAASPNMGYQSSPALAFVMALFNVRLGWWLGNPNKNSWRKAGPTAARFQLVREAFGMTDDEGKWVYLSDGGHFENLGLYEMVLRRCRYIVVCDAGADPKFTYEDLGNAIHKIRVDLGIDITLEPGSTLPSGTRDSQSPFCHHAHFNIGYKKIHGDSAEDGKLLYIKPAFYQAEADTPVDIFHYAQGSKEFPHETTADQFFSESQFESYRKLGMFTVQGITGITPNGKAPIDSIRHLISLAAKSPCKTAHS